MALKIDTYSNVAGGNAFYKAIVHPLAAEKVSALFQKLRSGPVAIYDPNNFVSGFDEFYPLSGVAIEGVYVQNIDHIGRMFRDLAARPVTDLANSKAKIVFVANFDAEKSISHIRHLIPQGAEIVTLDAIRIPSELLSTKSYLSKFNFATNYAFFRDASGQHTRITHVNYWAPYGGTAKNIWFRLFSESGAELATWSDPLPVAGAPVVVDSKVIRERFKLPAFTGQLFMHIIGAAGHDVVKYALDTYGDAPTVLSCTHDANSWPSDQFAGLPAPADGEDVVLWVQNSHPRTIPAGEVGLNLMGDANIARLDREIAPFATYRLSVSELLPKACWPEQIEIQAAKNFVRPRYEIFQSNGRQRIAHPNVERVDLKPDKRLAELGNLLGKLYILPAPILPMKDFISYALPTPMATTQKSLPVKALIFDSKGKQVAEHSFGNLKRSDSTALDLTEAVNGHPLDGGFGHAELIYDFAAGQEADGWLHALFRYRDRKSGHFAETSFGAHIFNTALVYKDEPQSYSGPAPGLTTRLFLRVGPKPYETICHLIYPASQPWHEASQTALILTSSDGKEIARREKKIACSGSLLFKVSETFAADELSRAGENAYVVIRDTTCRLFGYHGMLGAQGAFSLDHMFGF